MPPAWHRFLIPLTLLTLLFLSGCGQERLRGNPDNGKRWYALHRCNGCHGATGLGGKAPELANLSLSFNTFIKKIRSPGSAMMPSYDADRISDQDLADIYSFLKQQQ